MLALSLEQRFAAGAPFAAELAGLSQLGVGADALAPLKPFAESGAPSLSALAASWAKVEPAVAAATPPPERSGWDRLLDHMRALVRVRRVGEAGEATNPGRRSRGSARRWNAAMSARRSRRSAGCRRLRARPAPHGPTRPRRARRPPRRRRRLRADAIGGLAAAKD